ncbi:MAG: LysM peptidoglycan-binding domain-containing protein [Mariprofundaceae bacterium]
MKLQQFILIAFLCVIVAIPLRVNADALTLPGEISAADIRSDLPQPYVVTKGDTLWDIANHFFKNPQKWLKIWERNLDITNPDLIYPGNEIWFNVKKKKAGGLTVVSTMPEIIYKPVERLEPKADKRLSLTPLIRQDFINAGDLKGVGYILDSKDERLNYGSNDHVYVKLAQAASPGDLFDIFRTGEEVINPVTEAVVGVLVDHLGTVRVNSSSNGIYSGKVVQAFEEIERGDFLKPVKVVDLKVEPTYPQGNLVGTVLFIRQAIAEGGQNQIIGVDLGLSDGMKSGTAMSIHRAGRIVEDSTTGEDIQLPDEKIGELLILVAQEKGSMALITDSTIPVNIGDVVRNQAEH